MAITRVQTVAGTTTGTGTVTVSWSPATTAGNFLVVIAAANEILGDVTFTGPTGFTALTQGAVNATGSTVGQIWYKENCSASEADPTVTTSAVRDIACRIFEYSGIATSSSIDKEAESSGSSTSADTGTTATTTVADELWIAFIACRNTTSTNTGSMTALTQTISAHATGSNRVRLAPYETIATATGTATNTATLGATQGWTGQVATFKGGAVTHEAAASLTATGTLAAAATVERLVSASLSATATLAAVGTIEKQAAASLTATATLEASATVVPAPSPVRKKKHTVIDPVSGRVMAVIPPTQTQRDWGRRGWL